VLPSRMIAESIKCMTPLCSKGGDPIQELNVDKGKGSVPLSTLYGIIFKTVIALNSDL
jgi:hypothetical protein